MVRNVRHATLPAPDFNEANRQRFVLSLKLHLTTRIRPRNEQIYEDEVLPRFLKTHGRAPQSREEIQAALLENSRYQAWCTMHRASQEMMWQSVGETIFREQQRIEEKGRELRNDPQRLGSLELDQLDADELKPYQACHLHLQPGGYIRNRDEDDILAGAFYEAGGNLYAMGRGTAATDTKAGRIIKYLAEKELMEEPLRVLDMGCSAGASTVPYAQAWPEAEVHGIDLGAGLVRYAHGRAESMGVAVHFHQMDAGATTFADGYFDLVVSHNLFHEISNEKRRQVMKESKRLLRPGGICLHQDVALQSRGRSLFWQADRAWDQFFNNEAWWLSYSDADCGTEMREAGFDDVVDEYVEQNAGPSNWYVVMGRRP